VTVDQSPWPFLMSARSWDPSTPYHLWGVGPRTPPRQPARLKPPTSPARTETVPTGSAIPEARGFTFVVSTIFYADLQSVGVVSTTIWPPLPLLGRPPLNALVATTMRTDGCRCEQPPPPVRPNGVLLDAASATVGGCGAACFVVTGTGWPFHIDR